MILKLGNPEFSNFERDKSWTEIVWPKMLLIQITGFALSFPVAIWMAEVWSQIPDSNFPRFAFDVPQVHFWLGFPLVLLAHEFLHVMGHPRFGLSRKSTVGFWPVQGVAYATYDGAVSRERLLVIVMLPWLVLSFVPLVVAATMRHGFYWVAFVSTFNTLISSGDLVQLILIMKNVPRGSVVRSAGRKTFYRTR